MEVVDNIQAAGSDRAAASNKTVEQQARRAGRPGGVERCGCNGRRRRFIGTGRFLNMMVSLELGVAS
jgi:hypothetical protein